MSVTVTILQNGSTTVAESTTQPQVNVSVAATVGPAGADGPPGTSVVNTFTELTDAATVAWDYEDGNIAEVTLGGNRTLSITNVDAHSFGTLKVIQDATGSRTLTLPGNVASDLSLSANPDSVDILNFYYDGTEFYWRVDNYPALDPDAIAFINASGFTTGVDDFVTTLKDIGMWDRFSAAYPYAGTTAATQKWNLVDPRDLDAAYRQTFIGGVTHSAQGVQGNGTNGYINTHLVPADDALIQNDSVHISFFARNAGTVGTREMGTVGANGSALRMILSLGGVFYADAQDSGGSEPSPASPVGPAFYIISRNSTGESKVYRNGVLYHTKTAVNDFKPTVNTVSILAQDDFGFSTTQCGFASIGMGIESDAQALDFYNAVIAWRAAIE